MIIKYLKCGFFYSTLIAFVVSWIYFYTYSSTWKADALIQNVSFSNGSGMPDETSLRILLDSGSFFEAVKKRTNNLKIKNAKHNETLKSLGLSYMISRNTSITRVQLTSRSRDEATELINILTNEFVSIQNEIYSNEAICKQLTPESASKKARLVYAPVVKSDENLSDVIKLFFVILLLGLLVTYCLYFYKNS